jgi:hypothetical protein
VSVAQGGTALATTSETPSTPQTNPRRASDGAKLPARPNSPPSPNPTTAISFRVISSVFMLMVVSCTLPNAQLSNDGPPLAPKSLGRRAGPPLAAAGSGGFFK